MSWKPPPELDEYRLVQRLGSGTMGVVYLAHDRLLDRPVAIKFLRAALNRHSRQRFVIEARATARIQHPNVMAIHRVGQIDDHPYIVSEYVRGTSLNELPRPVPSGRVLELAIGLARGLATTHRHGVLHRDIKLSNVILEEGTNEVKLLDFSLAKLEDLETILDEYDDEAAASPQDSASSRAIEGQAEPRVTTSSEEETLPLPSPEPRKGWDEHEGLMAGMAQLDREWHQEPTSLTHDDAMVGTPHYMAPELWRGQPASRETDVYALGVLLYILCVGKPPHAAPSVVELGVQILERPMLPIREVAPSIEPRLAAIIERCLRAEPAERFRSGEALREALETLRSGERRPTVVTDNPYRGLRAFEAEHRDLFFGRGAELRAVLERMRADAFVLVAGDSGVGKSSLCRAGVGPSVVEGAIEPERRWSYATMTPGRHPLRSLVSILVSSFELDHDVIMPLVETRPDTLGWMIHKKLGSTTGKLLFIDQLEELVTISDRGEAEAVGRLLAQLAAGVPGVRLLATVRGDFLTRVATIPFLGEELSRAIYLLRPLSPAGMREAIVGPAEAMDVHYESPELVDELVTAGIDSSLPILQFALAELWEARSQESGVITADDLEGIGGVFGALARHAEGLMASLLPTQRIAAKALLLRLVTIDDTRASLTFEELVSEGDDDSRLALEALVRGRLLVVREDDQGIVYEIAHEALIRDWHNLRRWLDEAAGIRELRHRLEVAATDWDRLGRPRTGLWSTAQLDEAAALDRGSIRPRELEFIAASQRAAARGRLVRRAAAVAIPAALLSTYGVVRWQAHAELESRVDAHMAEAEVGLERAESSFDAFSSEQQAAFAQYDAGTSETARKAWDSAKAHAQTADLELASAARELERALTLDPEREDARDRLGDALLRRAELAEHRLDEPQVNELLERLALYDEDGERLARWHRPARVSIDTSPPGAGLALVEYRLDDEHRRVATEPQPVGRGPVSQLELPPGSYRLELALEDRPTVLYPFIVGRAESLSLSVEIPPADAIPGGFVYVPAGRFLFGCSDEVLCEVFYESVPIHQVTTDSFLIARHEVTYGEWIEFLEDTPPERRAELTPRIDQAFTVVSLSPVEDGGWELAFPHEGRDARARQGELLTFPDRDRRRSQDWLRMPVLAITFELASAYIDWLDRIGRVPGARTCTDQEWERAGRGADGRLYPHGDHLDPDDINIDTTYGKRTETAGPDVVGSHTTSRSPFGVDDLSGNAGEWAIDPLRGNSPLLRGGAFFLDMVNAHLVTRQFVPPGFTEGTVGMRVCAPFPLPRPIGEPRRDDKSENAP
ncbi:protein kinase [Paraliomyxa miuraensis]|nr:protein kinase [Paraliomyxa miuraensis]